MTLRVFNEGLLASPPTAVCLDLDNTLYDYGPAHRAGLEAALAKMGRDLGLSKGKLAAALASSRSAVKARLGTQASSHSRLLYFQGALEALGLRTQPLMALDLEQAYWRDYLHNCRLHDGALEFLYALRAMGVPTALVTDLTARIQFRKAIYLGLDGLIDFMVTSEEAGADKPDPAPFKLALEKIGLPAGDIWMVGDSYEADAKGSLPLGFRAILKGREKYGDGTPRPWAEFDSFGDLVGALGRFETPSHGPKEGGRP